MLGLLVVVVLSELGWLVLASLALRGSSLRAAINQHPEELVADWRAARSWFPGRLSLEGFTIRGQDERDQWSGEAEQVELSVQLLAIARKQIVADRVSLRGVSFRLRPRLDAVPEGSVNPANLPPISGYENPPKVAPAAVPDSGESEGRHWAIRLSDIRVDDLREVWVNEGSLGGGGTLRGRVDYTIRGPFETEVFELRMPAAAVRFQGVTVSTNLELGLVGSLGPLKFSDTHGAAYFQKVTAVLDLHGPLGIAPLLSRHLGITDSMALTGNGAVEARVAVGEGALRAPSHLNLRSTGLALRLGDVTLGGDSRIGITVVDEGGKGTPVSTMNLDLTRLQLRHRDESIEATESGEVHLRASALDASFPDGFRQVSIDLKVGPLEVPEARILNGFLPGQEWGGFLRGSFRVEAQYQRPIRGDGEGQVQLGGEDLAFRLGAREYTGRVAVQSGFRLGTNRLLTLRDALVLVTNATMTGVRNRQADGWHARVEVDQGSIALADDTRVNGDVRLALLDTRPLLALLREDEDSPGWLRFVPTLKNLAGGARVSVAPAEIGIHDLRLRGAAAEVLGQLTLRNPAPDGILYARYGLVSAGFDFRNGGRDWTIFGAKRKYKRALKEMQLEAAEAPAGDDDAAEESTPVPASDATPSSGRDASGSR